MAQIVKNLTQFRKPGFNPWVGKNGNLLQYSCLENPMDRGARWAAVHRVTKSWTQLKRLSTYACLKTQLRCRLPDTAIHNPMTPSIYAYTVEHTEKCSLTCLCSLLDCKSLKGLLCISPGTVFLMPRVAPGTWQGLTSCLINEKNECLCSREEGNGKQCHKCRSGWRGQWVFHLDNLCSGRRGSTPPCTSLPWAAHYLDMQQIGNFLKEGNMIWLILHPSEPCLDLGM